MMNYFTISCVLWLIHLIENRFVIGQKYFIASFQTGLEGTFAPDENVWLEFLNEVHPSKEFTICHWINIKFLNSGISACLWSYCTVEKEDDPMECLQLCLDGIWDTANRNMQLLITIPSRNEGQRHKSVLPLKAYHHRTWNHLCWTLSTITEWSTFYHNGNEIGRKQVNTTNIGLALKGSSQMHGASFIFGQEPDSIRGGFNLHEAFIGDLTEFNVWNYTLSDSEIYSMAACDMFARGNVVSWELNNQATKKNIAVHNVEITEFANPTVLCNVNHHLVIFPEIVQFAEAKETCVVHGGSLAVPRSEEETNRLIEIVQHHKDSCIKGRGQATENLVWIGAKQVDGIWQEVPRDRHHWSDISSSSRLSFTNFLHSGSSLNSKCAYLRKDGFWMEGDHNLCTYHLSLCTICVLYRQPVFTLKGSCVRSPSGWNYYPIVDSKNQIQLYESYKKKSRIYLDEKSQNWSIAVEPDYIESERHFRIEFSADPFAGKYPIGRKNWLVKDPHCGLNSLKHSMTLSVCDVPLEFTCDSGHCVHMKKRCDGEKDCIDGSDEYKCKFVNILSAYDNAVAPEPKSEDDNMDIHIHARILKIDSIDTINMMVALTMELYLEWYDGRLSFFNAYDDQDNIITDDESKLIWTPMRNLVHENAVVGDVIYDQNEEIKMVTNAPEPLDILEAIENVVYNGSYNPLALTRRMKIKYDCTFDVKKFPFDEQNCSVIMKISNQKLKSLRLKSIQKAVYEGPTVIDQFSIGNIDSNIEQSAESTRYTITIHGIRNYTNQLLNTFIPTLILWLFGYSTLFIDMSNFSDRFVGAGTSLLVIATLFAAISSDLPKTSYMKLIDIWFLWHNISILTIIVYHIILNKLQMHLETLVHDDVTPFEAMNRIKLTKLEWMLALRRGNNIFIMTFPFLNVLFYAIYFQLSVY